MNPNRQSTKLPDNADDLFDDGFSSTSSSSPRFRQGPSRLIFVLIGFFLVFLILGASLLLFLKTRGAQTQTLTQSPVVYTLPEDIQRATPIPTLPIEPVDVSALRVRVLNGSGIPGAAGVVKAALEEKGFVSVEATNAATFDAGNTEVKTKSSVEQRIVDIIINLLTDYTVATGKELSDDAGVDIEITVGQKET